MEKRCWATVDLGAIVNNYKIFKEKMKDGQSVFAVVKANAYGHGDVKVSLALQEAGCKDYAVSNLEEGIRLRNAGIDGNILILGYTPLDCVDKIKKYDIIQAVFSKDYYLGLIEKNIRIKVHFKIDTGMNRIGFKPNDETELLIRQATERLEVNGIFTHLCVCDTPNMDYYTDTQIKTFRDFYLRIKDLKLPFVHCQNTIGGMRKVDDFTTHSRLGISLYGLKPDYDNVIFEGMKPALEWRSVISMIKTLKKGEKIGYGLTYETERETKVATVSAGYADGYNRRMSNGGTVIVKGKKAKIIGRVCMDQFMIDVTDIKDVKPYDEVVLIGEGYTADDMGKDLGTISYEVVTGISSRVSFEYKN